MGKIVNDIEQDDRLITVATIITIYPYLSIAEVFEILEDPLLLETLLIEMSKISPGSIDEITNNII
jgi:hypothetical protein